MRMVAFGWFSFGDAMVDDRVWVHIEPPCRYGYKTFTRPEYRGRHLQQHGKNKESIVLRAFELDVPIFCPAFSDCSAGFGLVEHQYRNGLTGKPTMSLDSAKDFLELTRIKMASKETGLFMIGGGVPKNFAQDIVVAADILGDEAAMHKYAVQITVADERDGALSGSTLKEASSWGKVSTSFEQMVYGEATVFFPLIAGYAYHKDAAKNRQPKRFSKLLDQALTPLSD